MAAKKKQAEEKVDTAPSKDAIREAFLANFNKHMRGRGQLTRASEVDTPGLTMRIPTGILGLDVALGGGFPCGGFSQIAGPKNSCKSYLYWQMIRQLQSGITFENTRVLLAMTEMHADKQQGRLAGVKVALSDWDIAQMEKARAQNKQPPFTPGEIADLKTEIGVIDEFHAESGEVLFDGILQAVANNIYHLVVIDSFGSIMTEAEAEAESLTKKTYGGSAKLNTEFLRKLNALLTMTDEYGRSRTTCVLGINQARANIGDPYKEIKFPGGFALEHAQLVNLSVTSGAPTYGHRGKEQQKEETIIITREDTKKRALQTGKEINWKIEKGKMGIHEGAKGLFEYVFDSGQADFFMDALSTGVDQGVIEQAGSWFGLPDGNGDYLVRAQKNAFVDELIRDAIEKSKEGRMDTHVNTIRDRVFQRKGISVNYNWG